MGRKSEQNGTVYLRKWKTNRELKGNNDKNFRFNFEMYTYHARRGPLDSYIVRGIYIIKTIQPFVTLS